MEEMAELNAFATRYGNAELAIEVSRSMVAVQRGQRLPAHIADHFTDGYAEHAVTSAEVAMDALLFDGRKVVRDILGRIARSYMAEDIQVSSHYDAQAGRVAASRGRWEKLGEALDRVSQARLAVCLAIDALALAQPGFDLTASLSAAKEAVATMEREIGSDDLIDVEQRQLLRSFSELGLSQPTNVPAVAADVCSRIVDVAAAVSRRLDAALVSAAGIIEDETEFLVEIERPYLQRAALLVPERIAALAPDFGAELKQKVEGLTVNL
ncbi:hypothetical protein [Rhizobium sp. BK176]|uniref:hypothetical protein n=1 Tax=Rhizobium sp. BK176 TaxID=2587071 RepID=UPI0021671F4E|nr:hypothetical protein [Rhizobium sp. BK176]MCS4088611.1 hypothetical protein [Rhizobium sp. BK176]